MNLSQDMPTISPKEKVLIEKIRTLAPERVSEVENFVNFLRHRNDELQQTRLSAKISENAFRKVWDNPEDVDYDRL